VSGSVKKLHPYLLEAATDVLISPQGLNERFNPAAVQLLHDILTKLLQKKIAAQPAISGVHTEHFRRVVLKEWFSIRLLAFLFGMIVP
jgi:hypothetical protein